MALTIHKAVLAELYASFASLTDKQAKHLYAFFFLDMIKVEIARAEKVDERAVRDSIERGLKKMEKNLKKLL